MRFRIGPGVPKTPGAVAPHLTRAISGSTNGAETPMLDRECPGSRRTLCAALAFACLPATAGWTMATAIAEAKPSRRVDEPVSLAEYPVLSIDDAGMLEGNVGFKYLVFTARLSAPAVDSVSVDVT